MLHVWLNRLLATSICDSEAAFALFRADESAGCEACWFWQTEYIQSNYSAVFSSYVTIIRTRGRTNIKPQDPGEPKEPFSLVPHPLLLLLFHIFILRLSSSGFLFLGQPPSSFLLCLLSPFSLLFFHSPCASSPCLHPLALLPFLIFALLLLSPSSLAHYLGSQVSSSRTPAFTPNLPFCLSIIQAVWPLPLHRQPHSPKTQRNVIDRTGKTSPFHSHALPIPSFHINVQYLQAAISQPKDL